MNDAVLVTGGTGFIGRELVKRLRAAGREVIVLGSPDGDIANPATLDRCRKSGIGSVVHTAARTFVPDSWNDPAGFIRTNVLGTTHVLQFCRETGARLTYLSAYIYGQPDSLPIAENAPIRANNPYAQSKYLAEQQCRFYAENFNIPVTIIRPFNAFGPDQDARYLIPIVLAHARAGKAIEVIDLEPRRDFIFITDLVSAIETAERRAAPGCEVFNIGSGESYSVAEIVGAIQTVAGTTLEVRSRNIRRDNEIPDVIADISAARRVLSWAPQTSLSVGLRACWLATAPDVRALHPVTDRTS